MRASDVKSAEDVAAFGRTLLGADPGAARGLVQPLASWVGAAGERVALRICEATPRSDSDFFLLNLARARADAIFTTGSILRAEAGVTHTLQGPGALPEALAAWRRALDLRERPLLLVLSSGRGLGPDHPAFHAAVDPVLFVPERAASALAVRFSGTARVVGAPATGAREAAEWLRNEGIERITIEAGPSASASLYETPCLIDELWRSTYLDPGLAEEVVGPTLLPDERVDTLLPTRSGGTTLEERSGPWRFERRAGRAAG